MTNALPLRSVSDDDLLRRLAELTLRSRRVEVDLLMHIGEVDARRLYLREACASMFAYCTERLHLSEAEAFLRITAARAAREHPVILTMLSDGRLHLSAVARLSPHLTAENRDAVLQRAAHRSKREILELVAELSPRPDAPETIRKLPTRSQRRPEDPLCGCLEAHPSALLRAESAPDAEGRGDSAVSPAPPRREQVPLHDVEGPVIQLCPDRVVTGTVEPIAPARYKVQFTATAELREKLERLRALLRSSIPGGDLASIIDEAVTEKLARLEAARFGRTERPRKAVDTGAGDNHRRPSSRHVPARVRRAVYKRDGGRCTFRDAQGRRCTARDQLQYHHRHPYGYGGDHSVDNVALVCRAHNHFLERIDHGTGWRLTAVAGSDSQAGRPLSGRRAPAPPRAGP